MIKFTDLLVLGGISYIVYVLLKKDNKIVKKDIKIEEKKDIEPENVKISLSNRNYRRDEPKQDFYSQYNTSKFATYAPPRVTIS
jgi:hypothetical protein